MKKIISSIILIFFVSGCTNFDFVYNGDFLKGPLVNTTKLVISGDDIENASIYLKDMVGDTANSTYNLKIIITKTNFT